ncbi:MAG: GH39 family glycosyl hydrolase [Armatimonadota bacterium]
MIKRLILLLIVLVAISEVNTEPIRTRINIDAGKSLGTMKPLWRDFAEGSESTDPDYLRSTEQWLKPLKPRTIRTDTTVEFCRVSLDSAGNVVFDFKALDHWIELVRGMGADPILCLSYTPPDLQPKGGSGISPPTDLKKWEEVVYGIVKHVNVDKGYNVRYWEVWNEPNHSGFWSGTMEQYFDLYAATTRGALRADPTIKIGGGAFSSSVADWLKGLMDYAKANNLRLDFVSWHDYNEAPEYYKQTARRVQGYLHDRGMTAELMITEWNWHPGMVTANDNEVGASYVARCLHHMVDSPLDRTTFFEIKDGWKAYARYWGRWGLITYDNHPKAVYYVYKAFSHLSTNRVSLLGGTANVNGLASRDGDKICAIIYNSGTAKQALVDLDIRGLPDGKLVWKRYLIDPEHSNPLNQGNDSQLEKVEDLVTICHKGELRTSLELEPYSVSLICLEPAANDTREAVEMPLHADKATKFRTLARKTDKPLIIDGDLSDWKSPAIRGGWCKPVATCRFAWDNSMLYIAVQMHEADFIQNMPDSEIWAQDSLQVGFDTLSDARFTDPYIGDDYEYGFAITPRGPVVWRWECPSWKEAGPVPNVKFSGNRDEHNKVTTYEIAIPWSELDPFEPRLGAVLKIGLTLNDVGKNTERDAVEWGGGIAGYKEPALFRPVQLAE